MNAKKNVLNNSSLHRTLPHDWVQLNQMLINSRSQFYLSTLRKSFHFHAFLFHFVSVFFNKKRYLYTQRFSWKNHLHVVKRLLNDMIIDSAKKVYILTKLERCMHETWSVMRRKKIKKRFNISWTVRAGENWENGFAGCWTKSVITFCDMQRDFKETKKENRKWHLTQLSKIFFLVESNRVRYLTIVQHNFF